MASDNWSTWAILGRDLASAVYKNNFSSWEWTPADPCFAMAELGFDNNFDISISSTYLGSSFLVRSRVYAAYFCNPILSNALRSGGMMLKARMTLWLISFEVVCNLTVLDEADFNSKVSEYKAAPHRFQYLDSVVQRFPSQTLTAGVPLTLKYSGVSGRTRLTAIYVRPNVPTGNNLTAYVSMDTGSFNLLDANSQTLTNGALTGEFLRYHEFAEKFTRSQMALNVPLYFISQCRPS